MKNQFKHLKKGFTLSELIAVIVIIGILVGIGLGSYLKAIERSRFADGLAGAHALAAAADAYYYDNNFEKPTTVSQLGISFAKTKSSVGTTISTENFDYTYSQSVITATRDAGAFSYTINVYPEMRGDVKADECQSSSSKGKEFCQSMGYTSCPGNGNVCTKP